MSNVEFDEEKRAHPQLSVVQDGFELSQNKSKMIGLVSRLSFIKTSAQASAVLMAVTIFFFLLSVFIFWKAW